MTYTIDIDNNITAGVVNGEFNNTFASQKELAKLAAEWPMSRLVDIWNSFAGVAPFDDLKPVKKFQTREIAVNRIWAAIARLDRATASNAEPEPETPKAEPKAARAKKEPVKPPKKQANKKRAPEPPKAGLVYEREYKDKKYVLTSADKDGKVVYHLRGGDTYDSLTAAAKAVTQYPSISGPAFWGEGSKAAAK
ncbi:MAG TPA: DUF2924 domain-containing protein [Bryobacteraceae bacterium]|nr:DUF2924 domain-containing protein [Bryobacteraceae bacterium]